MAILNFLLSAIWFLIKLFGGLVLLGLVVFAYLVMCLVMTRLIFAIAKDRH